MCSLNSGHRPQVENGALEAPSLEWEGVMAGSFPLGSLEKELNGLPYGPWDLQEHISPITH